MLFQDHFTYVQSHLLSQSTRERLKFLSLSLHLKLLGSSHIKLGVREVVEIQEKGMRFTWNPHNSFVIPPYGLSLILSCPRDTATVHPCAAGCSSWTHFGVLSGHGPLELATASRQGTDRTSTGMVQHRNQRRSRWALQRWGLFSGQFYLSGTVLSALHIYLFSQKP